MIRDIEKIGLGLGPKIIGEFVSFLKSKEPTVRQLIIDPDPENLKAIRAFARAGFLRDSEI